MNNMKNFGLSCVMICLSTFYVGCLNSASRDKAAANSGDKVSANISTFAVDAVDIK